jgi:hypothetical protein
MCPCARALAPPLQWAADKQAFSNGRPPLWWAASARPYSHSGIFGSARNRCRGGASHGLNGPRAPGRALSTRPMRAKGSSSTSRMATSPRTLTPGPRRTRGEPRASLPRSKALHAGPFSSHSTRLATEEQRLVIQAPGLKISAQKIEAVQPKQKEQQR